MSSLLDMLGYVGDSLDKPGRAVRGLLSGNAREGLAAIPFSDAMGLTDQAERVSGKDLLGKLGISGDGLGTTLAGIGTEIATDPLSWVGVGLGAKLGSAAGKAAMARGPRYGTTVDDLAKMGGHADTDALRAARPLTPAEAGPGGTQSLSEFHAKDTTDYLRNRGLNQLLDSPGLPAALRELPPGSNVLGAGVEGVAFRTPAGNVVRMGPVETGAAGRPVASSVAQPTRTIDFPAGADNGNPLDLRVERVPFVQQVGDEAALRRRSPMFSTPMNDLAVSARNDGLHFWDKHVGNAGFLNGKPVIVDPGAVEVTERFAGGFNPVIRPEDTPAPGVLMRALMGLGGGDDAVRAAIDSGRATPGMTRQLGVLGGGVGATTGAYSRL